MSTKQLEIKKPDLVSITSLKKEKQTSFTQKRLDHYEIFQFSPN